MEAIDKAIEMLAPTSTDMVMDIGAGDGNFIIACALKSQAKAVVGIEIDQDRATFAQSQIDLNFANSTDAATTTAVERRCRIICGNALDQDYSEVTCFFLYLVPRGLRIVLPIIKALRRKVRVVTYMSPFIDTKEEKKGKGNTVHADTVFSQSIGQAISSDSSGSSSDGNSRCSNGSSSGSIDGSSVGSSGSGGGNGAIAPIKVVKVSTVHHPEAQWPLYYYEIDGSSD